MRKQPAPTSGRSTQTLGGNGECFGGFDHQYPNGYSLLVYQLQQTDTFITWLSNLRDMRAKARIVARLEAIRLGNLGDTRSVGGRVSELRVDVGGGYRVYFTRRQRVVIILLCGGDKSTQSRDIARAKQIAGAIE
jgi:putative addiction module killer protein